METVGLMEMDTDYGCTFEMSVFRAVRQGVFEPSNGSAGCKKSLEEKCVVVMVVSGCLVWRYLSVRYSQV